MNIITPDQKVALKECSGIDEEHIAMADEVGVIMADAVCMICLIADKYGKDRNDSLGGVAAVLLDIAKNGDFSQLEIPERIMKQVERNK